MSTITAEQFNQLADEWDRGIVFMSFWGMMVKQPCYPQLLAFGKEGIPLVLDRIAAGDHAIHWSMLLSDLSGQQPNYEPLLEDGFAKFDVDALAASWVAWGRMNGYI